MIAYITLGGIFGTLARYLVQGMIQTRAGTFPSGTLAINIAGSFLLGFMVRFATGSTVVSPELRGGLTIGFCGAFTTMSTFSYESMRLLWDGEYWYAGLYACDPVPAGERAAEPAGAAPHRRAGGGMSPAREQRN